MGGSSVDLTEDSEVQPESPIGSPATQLEDESSGASAQPLADDSSVSDRRKLLDSMLKNYKQDKLKRKLPVDMQLLSCAQEELGIKGRLVENMEKMEELYSDNMSQLSNNMERLTNSISVGFSMLHSLIGQQPRYPYLPPQPGYPFHPAMLHTPSSTAFGSSSYATSAFDHDNYSQDP